MDINNLASYMSLEPSQLMRAERCVEQGLRMYNRDEELTENYLREYLGGSTLKYAMHLLGETTTSYMGVQIHNQNGKFSAPTAGVYNSSSRPELKAKIKEKVLKKNERENKNEEVELEEASMKQARKNVGADTCWKGYKAKGTKTKNGKSVPNCVKEEDIDEAVVGQDREMRKAASAERNKERSDRGGASPKIPGREGPSAGNSYADYQKLSIKSHDKLTKKNKNVVGLVTKEEFEQLDELSKKTMGSYINKAVKDVGEKQQEKGSADMARFDDGGEGDYYGDEKGIAKREKGIGRAVKRLTRKEEVENVEELYKGKHGQTEKQYQDSRSDAGKMVSGDSKSSGSRYAQGRRTSSDAGPQTAGGSARPQSQGKMDSGSRIDLTFRKAALKKKAADMKKEEVVNEEEADRLRDRRMERGGVDGNNRYNKSPGKPNTFGKKPPSGMSAMDKVVAKLKAKHGDNAIIAKKTVKNESVEDLEEKKMSKAAHKKAAKAGKRWQDSDGDGKWYEPGQDVKKEDYDSELTEQFNLLKGYLFENEIASTEEDVLEVFENITDEELEYCLEQALIQMKGKKKGNVIINPEVKKVTEEQDPDASKKLQVQKRQLMLNKQKIRLQQKATSAKQTTDMHTEENLQEVDVTTRANNFGAEIERTNVKQKKEKKSLKNFKQLSMGGKTTTEAVYGGTPS